MNKLDEILDKKQTSKEWSRLVAGRVLSAKRKNSRRLAVSAAALCGFLVVLGGVYLLRPADSLRLTFNSAMEEMLPDYGSNPAIFDKLLGESIKEKQ